MMNKLKINAHRYHDISCGHRVVGHEGKCRNLHGHNYRFHFVVEAEQLDDVGRVIDFSIIKNTLCNWLEENYDHKFLMWEQDPYIQELEKLSPESMVVVSFNPTAENIATNFIKKVAPALLEGTGCTLKSCTIEETRKCSATAYYED